VGADGGAGGVYAYARRTGHPVDEAQDLTQSFFARFLEKRYVQAADPERGRFRSFLLACFKHFIANERDRAFARKRGGARLPISLELDEAEARYAAEPADWLTPEALFEQQWARGLIDRVLAKLRAECVEGGREALFDRVKDRLVGEKAPGGYAALARALDTTEGSLKVTIHRLRRRFRHLLRVEIAATVSEDDAFEDEMRHLMSVFTAR
jgi:RNA polymerase sigma factor (sigma-70 family)